MRVFTAVRHANDSRQFYGGLWSANFYPALGQLGHEIVESQTDLLPTSQFMQVAEEFTPQELAVRGETTARILEEVRAAHRQRPLGLFLSYFYNAHFEPAGFEEIHRLGIPTINFYCNSIYQFELVAAVAAKAQFSWYPERDAASSYARAGARGVRMQMGADPDFYRPMVRLAGAARQADACFVGQRYADRDRWMASLIHASMPVTIYGPGWGGHAAAPADMAPASALSPPGLGRNRSQPGSLAAYIENIRNILRAQGLVAGLQRVLKQVAYRRQTRRLQPLFVPHARGPLPAKEIARVFSEHEVVLNFSNVWADGRPGSALIPHVRLRDFEAPMCGACYLTGHMDELAEFYEIGREIDTYRSAAELVDKTRFYLSHPDAAEKLRQAGGTRARRDHTWRRRFEQLFAAIGLNP